MPHFSDLPLVSLPKMEPFQIPEQNLKDEHKKTKLETKTELDTKMDTYNQFFVNVTGENRICNTRIGSCSYLSFTGILVFLANQWNFVSPKGIAFSASLDGSRKQISLEGGTARIHLSWSKMQLTSKPMQKEVSLRFQKAKGTTAFC